MASVALGRADLALFSEPGTTRVVIPTLYAMAQRRGRARAFVQFEGDDYPTAFHGTSRTRAFDLTCRFASDEHAEMLALLDLVDETAPGSPDPRLLLRTHIGLAAGLNPSVAVELTSEVTESPLGAGVFDVVFSVQVVQHSFEVA